MRKRYNKELGIKELTNYLKKQSDWTRITLDNAAEIIGMGQTYAMEVLKLLREAPDVAYKLEDTTKKKTTCLYKYIGEEVAPKNEVKKEIKAHSRYKNLNTEEVLFATSIIENKEYAGHIHAILQTLNLLAGLDGRKVYIANYITKISDMLVVPTTLVKFYINIIHGLKLLTIKEGKVKLSLLEESKEVITLPIESAQPNVFLLDAVTGEMKNIDIVNSEEKKELPINNIEVKPEVLNTDEQQNNAIYTSLVDNLGDFKGFMENFQDFFQRTTEQIVSSSSTEIVKKLEEELEKGNNTMQACLLESKDLRSKIFEKNTEVKDLKSVVKAYKDHNDDLFNFMYERLQIVIAEITNSIAEFVQTPDWKRTAAINASFQNKIVSAITAATADILDKNNNKE